MPYAKDGPKKYFKGLAVKIIDRIADRIADRDSARAPERAVNYDEIAYRAASETIVNSTFSKKPNELFAGVSDGFWFWLLTEGCRRNSKISGVLPGMPEAEVQLQYTGDQGDRVLSEGFSIYRLCKEVYEAHVGPLAGCSAVLDFGCGWGRIIRFFLKDVEPQKLWGVDPVGEMIDLCRRQNRWCNFEQIDTHPPCRFPDNTFDLIYSFSVFSHLSEEIHELWLIELGRILKPGGLLIATTQKREFINYCASLRKREDLASMHEGPRSSASAFRDTQQSLSNYDSGKYCFSQLGYDNWSYWGETAIPKDYVLNRWTHHLTFVDFIEDRSSQNVIVMRKAGF